MKFTKAKRTMDFTQVITAVVAVVPIMLLNSTLLPIVILPLFFGVLFRFMHIKNRDTLSYGTFALGVALSINFIILMISANAFDYNKEAICGIIYCILSLILLVSLVLGIIFTAVGKASSPTENEVSVKFVTLADLKARNFITEEEYEQKRAEIVKDMKL